MKYNKLKGSICLVLAAAIWGSAFVAQSMGKDVGAFTFQGVRSIIGALFLIPVILIIDMAKKKNGTYKKPDKKEKKMLLVGGVVCGSVLCIAMSFQQIGIHQGAQSGKAGFITAMYILLVPVLGIFLKKRVPLKIWLCILCAAVGLYFLCMTADNGFTIEKCDIFVLLCAPVFALHIMVVDYFAPYVDGVKLSCIQFFVVGAITLILMFSFETPSIEGLKGAIVPILYAGIGSSGIAYTLQIVGQKYTPATLASLLMSLESVFALLSQMLIQLKLPTLRETFGCIIILCAIIFAQLPNRKEGKSCE